VMRKVHLGTVAEPVKVRDLSAQVEMCGRSKCNVEIAAQGYRKLAHLRGCGLSARGLRFRECH
jgi:hypothetical protein